MRQVNGKIGYFDFEMGIAETYDRLRRIGCANDEKVLVYDLVAAGFDLMADSSYEWIRSEINAAGLEIIVLDALRHIAKKKKDGNNDSEIQAIFTRLERLRKDCSSLEDIFIPAHTAKGDLRGQVMTSRSWDRRRGTGGALSIVGGGLTEPGPRRDGGTPSASCLRGEPILRPPARATCQWMRMAF